MEWAKKKANLLDTYEKCRQGLERAVQKLREEKEKQTAMEERRRAAWGKWKLKGRLPATSDSGGESTRGPPQCKWRGQTTSRPGGWPPQAALAEVKDH